MLKLCRNHQRKLNNERRTKGASLCCGIRLQFTKFTIWPRNGAIGSCEVSTPPLLFFQQKVANHQELIRRLKYVNFVPSNDYTPLLSPAKRRNVYVGLSQTKQRNKTKFSMERLVRRVKGSLRFFTVSFQPLKIKNESYVNLGFSHYNPRKLEPKNSKIKMLKFVQLFMLTCYIALALPKTQTPPPPPHTSFNFLE